MARVADPSVSAYWREHIRKQADSGLTIAEFCGRDGLSTASFHAWNRRLRLSDLANDRSTKTRPPAFLPVTLRIPDDSSTHSFAIEADLPNGIRLRIPTADARLACQLVRAVVRARTDDGSQRC
jgi:hypothetical protein